MHTTLTALAGAAALAVFGIQVSAEAPSKPLITNPTLNGRFETKQNDDLFRDLPARNYTTQCWDSNFIPKAFTSIAFTNGQSPYSVWDVETRNVLFSDCAQPSVVSLHRNASLSWDDILQTIGRVPIGMRQFVGNVLVVPKAVMDVPAYASGTSLVFQDEYHKLGVWAHEGTHVLDGTAFVEVVKANGYDASTRYSQTRMWADAFARDEAVVTPYGKAAGQGENFADIGRWAISDMSLPGGLADYIGLANRALIASQMDDFRSRAGNAVFPDGGSCTGKVASTPAVSKRTGVPIADSAGKSRIGGRALDWARALAPRDDVPAIVPPEGLDWSPIA